MRPSVRCDYISDDNRRYMAGRDLWEEFPDTIPLSIIDSRITDLVNDFFTDPDARLLSGYRRLEDMLRKRTGIEGHGSKLFSQVFQGKDAKLTWQGLDANEINGRAQLFSSTYMAFRNPRAHREVNHSAREQLMELLFLNSLFILESTATEPPNEKASRKYPESASSGNQDIQ